MKQHVKPKCQECGKTYGIKRFKAGYKRCLHCGDKAAVQDRKLWCIVQEYGKGPYQLVTPTAAKTTLAATNPKQVRT